MRKLDISYPTSEFVKMVKSWEQFEAGTMAIVIGHIKRHGISWPQSEAASRLMHLTGSSGLPDSCFDPGEREGPVKQLKRTKSKVRLPDSSQIVYLPLGLMMEIVPALMLLSYGLLITLFLQCTETQR
jgi:poly(A) polymerase